MRQSLRCVADRLTNFNEARFEKVQRCDYLLDPLGFAVSADITLLRICRSSDNLPFCYDQLLSPSILSHVQ